MISLDTNVLVYAMQPGAKRDAALAVLGHKPVLGVQVLNEFASVARRKLGLPWSDIAQHLDDLRALASGIVPVTDNANRKALALAPAYQLSWYDAVLVAVALENGVGTLYSEDMHHDLLIDGTLRIVDPFR